MYFSNFPTLGYPIYVGESLQYILCRNIIRRCALSQELKKSNGIFIEYSIKDGETPEHIAERIYGDPELHWIILLTNNIIDPYHDWYKSGIVLERYIQSKYKGYSIFFTNTSGVNSSIFYSSDIQKGITLTQGSISNLVEDYEPQLCKITTKGSGFVSGSATLQVSGGITYGIEIRRSIQSYRAVNYFKVDRPINDIGSQESITVDPFSENTGKYHETSAGESYIGNDISLFNSTYIGRYMGVSGAYLDTYSVSNYDYETNKNEQKRTIKILHPQYKEKAIKELESLLRV
jgi:hypothetical protein